MFGVLMSSFMDAKTDDKSYHPYMVMRQAARRAAAGAAAILGRYGDCYNRGFIYKGGLLFAVFI